MELKDGIKCSENDHLDNSFDENKSDTIDFI